MAKCTFHPGRNSVTVICGNSYCDKCRDGIEAARAQVDSHVQPKDCFVWYKSKDNWQPIIGTGCAHWVAHELNIRVGTSDDRCLCGFTYRVKVLVRSRTQVQDVADVKVNDIWASPTLDHTGLVIRVTAAAKAGDPPTITIRHDSSRQHKVADNDFATFFKGRGSFYR